LVIDFIANILSIFNTFISLFNKKTNNNFKNKYNHSKEIAAILRNGWLNPNIYYFCEFDPDQPYYYRITNSENPNIEDIPFVNNHLITGYRHIWNSKENVINETKELSKNIQQTIERFKQTVNEELSEQIYDSIKKRNLRINKVSANYVRRDDTNVYIEKNVIRSIFEILMYNEKIRDDDLSIFPTKYTNLDSKTFQCWKLEFKELNPLRYGDENIMEILKIKLLELLKNKDLVDLIENYKKYLDTLNRIIKVNNFRNGIKYICNEVYLEGKLIKGKCPKCN
jgi:hypothetical protein